MGGKKSIARTSVLVENMAVTIVFISLASSLLSFRGENLL